MLVGWRGNFVTKGDFKGPGPLQKVLKVLGPLRNRLWLPRTSKETSRRLKYRKIGRQIDRRFNIKREE